jgi:predicted ATPase
MIGEKVEQFQGKGTDLSDLQSKIEGYLKSEGFTTQTSPSSAQGTVIQAKKGGFLDGIIAADRALSIQISGDSSDFTVRIGIGKWLEHLGVAAVETLLLSDLFLVVDVGETAWNFEIENKLAKQIESFVG